MSGCVPIQDSGGYTASGEVPQAQPVQVTGERQLRAEVDGLIRHLNVDVEWARRIEALLRLEGLVRGGATGVPGFSDMLKALQEPIVVQLLDRCVCVYVVAANEATADLNKDGFLAICESKKGRVWPRSLARIKGLPAALRLDACPLHSEEYLGT